MEKIQCFCCTKNNFHVAAPSRLCCLDCSDSDRNIMGDGVMKRQVLLSQCH